ncbi:MAG: hypothetical protein AAF639_14835 [Chloroflexota bacterium]
MKHTFRRPQQESETRLALINSIWQFIQPVGLTPTTVQPTYRRIISRVSPTSIKSPCIADNTQTEPVAISEPCLPANNSVPAIAT